MARISEKSLKDVLEVRRAMEELAIELACQRMESDDIKNLSEAYHRFSEAVQGGEPMEIAEADEHFHDIIYEGTGNVRLIQLLNNLREQMYRYRLEYVKDEDKRQILLSEHERILKAVKERKTEEARELIRVHIDNQEITVSRNIKEKEGQ